MPRVTSTQRLPHSFLLIASVLILLFSATTAYSQYDSKRIGPNNAARAKAVNENIDTLVICPKIFQAELQRWIKYREQQGFRIEVQTPERSAHRVRLQVVNTARFNDLKHVVLVGDSGDESTPPQFKVPTSYAERRDKSMGPSRLPLATDNAFVDLDRDGIPDLSIGRMPVDSPDELKQYIDRIFEYEAEGLPVDSLRRINFVAGVGGFSKLIDSVIEETTKQIITDLVPGSIETTMTYGSWSSPYCPDPRQFSQTAIERFNEGCLFWVYIGHGAHHELDRVYMPDESYEILGVHNTDKISAQNGFPVAIFLSCNTAATDPKMDGLAETLLKEQKGPIATIGGSRITKPAAMALLSLSMMHEYFHDQTPTLGEIFLKAKRDMVLGSKNYEEHRTMIQGLANTFSPKGAFHNELLDHAHLIHLLGDPLLRLPRPKPILFSTQSTATPGEVIELSGKAPAKGELTFELAYRRDRLKDRFKRRRSYDPSNQSLLEYQYIYDEARDLTCKTVIAETSGGLFSAKFQIPEDIQGEFIIRAKLDTGKEIGIGSTPIRVSGRITRKSESDRDRKVR